MKSSPFPDLTSKLLNKPSFCWISDGIAMVQGEVARLGRKVPVILQEIPGFIC